MDRKLQQPRSIEDTDHMKQNSVVRISISVIAITAAAIHHLWPTLRADSFTGIMLIVAILPWLASVVKAVELPGGVKLELQEIREQALEAKGAAESAARQAETAMASTAANNLVFTARTTMDEAATTLEDLVLEYNSIRASMSRGPARTTAMTGIVGRMLSVVPSLQNFDATSALESKDRGMRLAGYVYLYARPDPNELETLLSSLLEGEDKPFNEYWAIRAIGNVASRLPDGRLPAKACRRLRSYLFSLPVESDRRYELNRVLAAVCDRVRERGSETDTE